MPTFFEISEDKDIYVFCLPFFSLLTRSIHYNILFTLLGFMLFSEHTSFKINGRAFLRNLIPHEHSTMPCLGGPVLSLELLYLYDQQGTTDSPPPIRRTHSVSRSLPVGLRWVSRAAPRSRQPQPDNPQHDQQNGTDSSQSTTFPPSSQAHSAAEKTFYHPARLAAVEELAFYGLS